MRYIEVRFAPQLHVHAGLRDATTWCARSTAASRRAADAFNARPEVASRRASRASTPASSSARCASSPPEFSPGYRRFFEALPEAPREPRSTRPPASRSRARPRACATRRACWSSGIDLAGPGEGLSGGGPPRGLPGRARGVPRQDRARGRGLRARVDLPGDRRPARRPHRPRHLALRRDARSTTRASPTARRYVERPRAVHRRQAHHDRGLPDLEPADGARARGRPAPPPVRRDAQAPALARRSAPTTGWSRTRRSRTRSRARSRRSRSPPREVRDILIYGFKRSFFPGTYLEKRAYVRQVIDYADRVLAAVTP